MMHPIFIYILIVYTVDVYILPCIKCTYFPVKFTKPKISVKTVPFAFHVAERKKRIVYLTDMIEIVNSYLCRFL